MCMLDEIRVKRDEIYAIARKHKTERLWVFGSCARKGLSCHEPHAMDPAWPQRNVRGMA